MEYPEDNLRKLCAFLNVEYDTSMLNIGKVDSSYQEKGNIGFDRGAVSQWRNHLRPVERSLINWILGADMKLFGYGEETLDDPV